MTRAAWRRRSRSTGTLALPVVLAAALVALPGAGSARAATLVDDVGLAPLAISLSPDDSLVYVADPASTSVVVVDAASETVVGALPTARLARDLVAGSTPVGERVYVAGYRPGTDDPTVSVTDPVAQTVVAEVPLATVGRGIAMTPDGDRVYVATETAGTLTEIDTVTSTVTRALVIGEQTLAVAVAPDGEHAYVTHRRDEVGATVSEVDVASGVVVRRMITSAGEEPQDLFGVAVAPDGSRLYLADAFADVVRVVDLGSGQLVATVPVGENPRGIAVSADGRAVHVAAASSGELTSIDAATLAVTSRPGLELPFDVDVSERGRVYVLDYVAASLTVIAPPEVGVISPPSGPVVGGASVTISGDRFDATASVTFGGVEASFTVDGDDQITTVVPAGASPGSVDVVLTSPDGAGRAATFSYTGPVATTLVAEPVLRTVPDLVAHLTQTAGGAPVVGKQVVFTGQLLVLPVHLCSATTDASGSARCSGGGLVSLLGLGSYTATFGGDATHLASTGRGALL